MTTLGREAKEPRTAMAGRPSRRASATASGDFVGDVEELYRTEATKLSRSLFGYSASRSITEDAVAESFTQLLRRGAEVRDPRAWVWRTAFRVAAGELQRQRRLANEVLVDLVTDEPDDMLDMVAALQTLSEMQRKAVVLHDYAGHRAAEVARMIGSTEAAVRVHLMRGRRRLRDQLA